MSDPFADLLSSFKTGGAPSPPKEATPMAEQKALSGTKPIGVHDDLDQLFGLKKANGSVEKAQLGPDSFDAAFEAFDRPREAEVVPEQHQEMVVDEVRDMEVAKLMSLDLDIDQANEYYEKGVFYEQLVKQRRDQEAKRRMRREQRQAEQRQAEPSDGGNLLSLASGLFERGKQLVDQLSGYPEEQDRLYRHRTRAETPPPASIKVEEDLLEQFNENLDLQEEPSRSPSPPPQEALLDFDNDLPAEEKSKSMTPVPISHIELSGYNEYKGRGSQFFKAGDYVSASQEYEKSLNSLPQNHILRIVAYSNLTAALFKVGEYKKCLSDIDRALELFPKDTAMWQQPIQDSQPPKSFKEIWPKIITRRAEAFEHTENYEKALQDYRSLIEHNFFNDRVMDGKRRCQKILEPPKSKPAQSKQSSPSVKRAAEDTAKPSNAHVNLARVQQENQREAAQEAEKAALYDKVFEQIDRWKAGQGDDIRHLLANLPLVLTWCEWKPVSTADLVMPKKVKITYMKAVAKTHPDKIPSSLELEKRMIAEDVFSALSIAWEKFKLANNIN